MFYAGYEIDLPCDGIDGLLFCAFMRKSGMEEII